MLVLAAFRIMILVVASGVTAFICWRDVMVIRDGFPDPREVQAGKEDQPRKAMALSLAKQSETLLNWSVLALAGIVTLTVSTKVRPLPFRDWVYILLGPAGALLLFACYAGVIFQGRIAFITLRNNFNDFASLNRLLNTQTSFFQEALILFSLFAAGFLVGIVQGKIDPAS